MNKRLRFAIAGVLWAALTAQGAQTVWTNTAGGDWNVAGNWTNGVPDDAAEDAVINQAGAYTVSLTSNMYLNLTNRTFMITNTNAKLDVQGVNYNLAAGINKASFTVVGGAAGTSTVTWVTGKIDLGAGVQTNRGDLTVTAGGALLTTNVGIYVEDLFVNNGARLTFGGPTNPSLIANSKDTGSITIESGGAVTFGPGTVSTRFSTLPVRNGNATYGRSSLILDGATLPGIIIQMQNTSTGLGSLLEIRSGSAVGLNGVIIGRQATTGMLDEMKVSGGNTTCSGTIQVGNNSTSGGKAHGIYTQTGGQLSCTTNYVGSHTGQKGGGYFNLTGGTNTVKSLQLYTDDTTANADNFGTRQFVVGSNAVLRLTGAGMLVSATNGWTGWLMNFSSLTNDFDTSGTIVFNPSDVVTQQLLAFSRDAGETFGMLSTNTAIGTLDLTGLNGAEKLLVMPASNETVNAVYINDLAGLSNTNAATLVDSALKIYYNGQKSLKMNKQRISLAGGGELIPLSSARPTGSLMLVR